MRPTPLPLPNQFLFFIRLFISPISLRRRGATTARSKRFLDVKFKPFQIDKYYFKELLGRGGMAEVYLAVARGAGSFEKEFAVKKIIPGVLDSEEAVVRFKREASLNSHLNHSNIVQVFDFLKADDLYLLVMEYVHGRDLSAVLKRFDSRSQRVPLEFALQVISEVCLGLDYAHRALAPNSNKPLNIVHRDISPHNIMVSYDGQVKIVDFGIAKATKQLDKTRTGIIRGKLPYMSPEQAVGRPLDHRSDIFSAALVLLEMVSGQPAYAGGTDSEMLARAQNRELPDFLTPSVHIPVNLVPILSKALRSDPEERFQDAGAMARQLKELLAFLTPGYDQHGVASTMGKLFKKAKMDGARQNTRSTPLSQSEEREILGGLKDFQFGLGNLEDDGHSLLEGHDQKERELEPGSVILKPVELNALTRYLNIGKGLKKRSRWLSRAAALAFLATIVVLFNSIFGKAHPRPTLGATVGATLGERKPEKTRSPAANEIAPPPAPADQRLTHRICSLNIGSAPSGAKAFVNEKPAGMTPTLVSVPCGGTVRVSLLIKGYRPFAGNFTSKKAKSSLRIVLNPLKGRR